MEETQSLLFENGTVWAVSTSGWRGADKLNADDLGKDASEIPDIFKLGSKYLIPDEVRIRLNGASSKVAAFMSRIGKPFFLKGAWFVPNKHLLTAREGINTIREEQHAIVEDMLDHYYEIRQQMIEKYPVLANANWPTPDKIRDRFNIRYLVFEVSGAEARQADPEDLIQAKRQFQQELRQAYNDYKDEILREAHDAIIEACEEINTKIMETGEKITESTLKKPKRIVDDYLTVASIFDMDEVKAQVSILKDQLDGAKAKELREDWGVMKAFASNLKAIGENVGDLSGYNRDGRLKRQVKKVAVA